MPKDRRTTIRIKTYEVTIIRFRSGDNADVLAYEQSAIPDDEVGPDAPRNLELPEAKTTKEQSNESNEQEQ